MQPLVSIITPTTISRAHHLPRIIAMIQLQDYPNIEHIVDHREEPNVGAKRNWCCKQAKGDIILHVDTDDFYSKDWVSKSVSHLLQSGAEITGLRKAYFLDQADSTLAAFDYDIASPPEPLLIGATMCYLRSYWERVKFLDIRQGEDNMFIWNREANVSPHRNVKDFLATTHDNNTSRRDITRHGWVVDDTPLKDFNHLF